MTTDVAAITEAISPGPRPAPLAGHEHTRGWGILACPLESGHVLALRVFPQSDFGPYVSVWHRTPAGDWAIYVDGPRLDTACPRYFGDATARVGLTDVGLTWTGPRSLAVEMADPALAWTVSVAAGPLVRAANAVCRAVPERLLRARPTTRLMEWLGDTLFDLGDFTLAAPVPNGQFATMLPRRLFPIADGAASLDGEDLGRPARAPAAPTFGAVRLPARPVLAFGRAYITIEDIEGYERLIEATRSTGRDDRTAERRPAAGHRRGPRTDATGRSTRHRVRAPPRRPRVSRPRPRCSSLSRGAP